jgi:N-dimethylarginine dimethylaminohydrolase
MEGFEEARRILEKELGINLVAVKLPGDPFFHLDCVFVRVNKHLCLAHKPALPDFFLKMLNNRKIEIIELSAEECGELKCNGVSVDKETFVSFSENKRVNKELESFGIKVLKPSYGLITLSGGGPRCSSFPLERDDVPD